MVCKGLNEAFVSRNGRVAFSLLYGSSVNTKLVNEKFSSTNCTLTHGAQKEIEDESKS